MKSKEEKKKIQLKEMHFLKKPSKKLRKETLRSNKPRNKKKQSKIKTLHQRMFQFKRMLQNKNLKKVKSEFFKMG
jgi:hypothetical protein